MSRKNPYKAFVSSTYADLKEHRAHVIWQLHRAGFFVDPMEMWTADTDEPKQFSQDRLEGCDLRGIDILPFMLDENAHWLAKRQDSVIDPVGPKKSNGRLENHPIPDWNGSMKSMRPCTLAGIKKGLMRLPK